MHQPSASYRGQASEIARTFRDSFGLDLNPPYQRGRVWTTDQKIALVRSWLIGVPTGRVSGFVVVDIDRKPGADGIDTLDEIGVSILPETPIVHTPSGGLHLYFAAPPGEVRNTAGARGRGLGRGLDFRGDGGYVIVPSPGSGYRWDAVWRLTTAPLAPLHPPSVPLPRR